MKFRRFELNDIFERPLFLKNFDFTNDLLNLILTNFTLTNDICYCLMSMQPYS